MDKVSAQFTQEDGNTKKSSFRSVFITWNNYPENWKDLLIHHFDKYVFQPEIGEKTGTHHIQGCGYKINSAKTFDQWKKILPRTVSFRRVKNWKACMKYCSKELTRNGETISNCLPKKIPDPLEGKELYPFQQDILNILDEPADGRTIHWIFEENGNVGKTTLARHLILTRKVIYLTGAAGDMKFGITKWIESKGHDLDGIILYYPREKENYVSYSGIEELVDAQFFSTKFESGMCVYPHTPLIVLCNFYPDVDRMSTDKWKIYQILKDKTMVQVEALTKDDREFEAEWKLRAGNKHGTK